MTRGRHDRNVQNISKVNPNIATFLPQPRNNSTHRKSLELSTERCRYDRRKYFFCTGVLSVWKSLLVSVTVATSVNIFKNRFDKFWENQEIMHNFKAQNWTNTTVYLITYFRVFNVIAVKIDVGIEA